MTQDSIEDAEQLVQTGDERHFLGLARGAQALIEGANDGVVPRGHQGGHVQDRADAGAATPDDTPPPQGAAVAIEWRDTHQRDKGLARERAQFGQVRRRPRG